MTMEPPFTTGASSRSPVLLLRMITAAASDTPTSAAICGLTIPASQNASTMYSIATVSSSKEMAIARAFVAYVLSPAGQQVLAAAGFQQP